MKKLVKLAATLLLVTLFVGSLPINIFAISGEEETLADNETKNALQTVNENSVSLSSNIDALVADGNIIEDISLREENVKHFQMPDGTYKAVVYPSAVHRKDGNGQWKDINNDISLKTVKSKQRYTTADERVSFSENLSANSELLSINENGHSISMSLLPDSSKQTLSTTPISTFVTNAANNYTVKAFSNIDEATRINNTSSIKYSNIRSNTDIEYVLQGNDVKENIILRSKAEKYTYDFSLMLTGLYAELNASGEINIYDISTREVEYIIPAPYMYDSAGSISYDVSYHLVNISEGRYILSVSANDKWINSDDRAFPVTIDPTIVKDSTIFDTYISSVDTENKGSASTLLVSDSETTLIKTEFPTLPEGSTFSKATLYVYYYYNVSSGYTNIEAHQILKPWGEHIITYNEETYTDFFKEEILSTATFSAANSPTFTSPKVAEFNISNAAAEWYLDPIQNFGIALTRGSDYSIGTALIKSRETGSNNRPYFTIDYVFSVTDGVYAIKNSYRSLYWMYVESGQNIALDEKTAIDGAKIQSKYSLSSPLSANNMDRAFLFKITRTIRAGKAVYIIRSMLNNRLSFNITSTGDWETKIIPSDDNAVEASDTFNLEWTGTGFLIKPNALNKVVNLPSDTSMNLTSIDEDLASFSASWSLELCEEEIYGVKYSYSNSDWETFGATPWDMQKIGVIGWSSVPNANTLFMQVDNYTNAASVWDSTTYELTVLPSMLGDINISVYIESNTSFIHQMSLLLPVIPEYGSYYIRNMLPYRGNFNTPNGDHFKYVSCNGNSAGTYVVQFDFKLDSSQVWEICPANGFYGYVTIKSYCNESMPLYLGIDVSSETIKLFDISTSSSLPTNILWKVTTTNNNKVKISCKVYEEMDIVLSRSSSLASNTSLLSYEKYSNALNQEWELMNFVHHNNVKLESQAQSKWCWVTVARMFAQNYSDSVIDHQIDAVIHVKGSAKNESGNSTDIKNAISFFLRHDPSNNMPVYAQDNRIYEYNTLLQLIDEGNVICIGQTLYVKNQQTNTMEKTTSHASLITGYIRFENKFWFLVYDPTNTTGDPPSNDTAFSPFPISGAMGGKYRLISYDDLKCAWFADGSSKYVWDLVVTNGNSQYASQTVINE